MMIKLESSDCRLLMGFKRPFSQRHQRRRDTMQIFVRSVILIFLVDPSTLCVVRVKGIKTRPHTESNTLPSTSLKHSMMCYLELVLSMA